MTAATVAAFPIDTLENSFIAEKGNAHEANNFRLLPFN
jgi:hypothetical protein